MQVYVDGTLGAGGHATAVVGEHPELRTLVGLDVDPLAHELAGARIRSSAPSTLSVHLIRSNFRCALVLIASRSCASANERR